MSPRAITRWLGALGGVNTNELLQVVDSTNTPISGLYATGNNVSGMSVAAYVNTKAPVWASRPAAVSRAQCRRGEQVISSPSKGRQV